MSEYYKISDQGAIAKFAFRCHADQQKYGAMFAKRSGAKKG